MKYTLHKLLTECEIVIPLIQRDYAQGRDSAVELRRNFLHKLKNVLENDTKPLNLDFVYGFTENNGAGSKMFIPLDGQQRLTTLWLVHWYFSLKENIAIIQEEKNSIQETLQKFTYETRISSKRFCANLISYSNVKLFHSGTISENIKDSSWYMASWNNDPTILSMLNMIDSIHEVLGGCENVWKNLVINDKVTFDYIDIKSDEFKLTDELYIKMNSRGKPLSPFENFKAQFSDLLSSKQTNYFESKLEYNNARVSYQQYFAFKIDSVWMDLFWEYRLKTKIKIDDSILNFIHFIADILYFKNTLPDNQSSQSRDFAFLELVFLEKQNVQFLFDSLDFLSSLQDKEAFFNEIFNEVSLFENDQNDLFLKSLTDVGFDVKHKTLLYSILNYCIKTQTKNSDKKLRYFIRIIRNQLLAVRQPNANKRIEYSSSLRLPSVADYSKFIDGLIDIISLNKEKDVFELFSESNLSGFTKDNINNEKLKAKIISKNPTLLESIFLLEDHRYIQGNTINFKLRSENLKSKILAFNEIWSENTKDSNIVRALLSIGDYSIETHGYSVLGDIWYFGIKNCWNRILTFDNDSNSKIIETLDKFLETYIITKGQNAEAKLKAMINNYDSETKDWRYYFVKYDSFSDGTFERQNLFTWKDENGFEINSLGNSGKLPLHSYHLNPYLICIKQLQKENKKIQLFWGRFTEISYLLINEIFKIYCVSDGWKIIPIESEKIDTKLIKKYKIIENENMYMLMAEESMDRIDALNDFIKDLTVN
ncbi:MAG: DUF262 domain-containing protein [Bacteroidetes bacterium]|nr:DUF262 domain-containing protein [Bacteroidota bacterium]